MENGKTVWSHVAFEHPATFDTLAMDADRKREIMEDLLAFSKGKDFYAKIGKPWKRGYLLYGPPGTGKSTMVAAMANLLDYDVYDLELTAVRNNAALRKLLVETTSKSIIVVEDIDCSQQLSSRRNNNRKKNKKKKRKDLEEEEYYEDEEEEEEIGSKVTLSGFLNFIDGLWSACGGERIIVFTTNHVERLDPGLIRRGRMDVHVELSYCTFEGFKVLARNYLGVEAHRKFARVRELVGERAMTPADVAECLMPRSVGSGADADERVVEGSLARLIRALERRKRNRNGEESVGNRNGGICEKGDQRNEPECCTWM